MCLCLAKLSADHWLAAWLAGWLAGLAGSANGPNYVVLDIR